MALILAVRDPPVPAPSYGASLTARDAKTKARLVNGFARMPLYFVENRGQLDSRVAFAVRGRDTAIYFTKEGVTFSLTRAEAEDPGGKALPASSGRESFTQPSSPRRWNVKLDFLGADPNVQVIGREKARAIVGICGVSPTAKSVAVNVPVVNATPIGNLTLYPAGASLPLASTLNYRASSARANNAVVPLGASGSISVLCSMPSGTADFILDVTGYFE